MQICYLIFLSYFLLLVAITPPLDSKEIKPVNPKRNKSWIFIGRTDAEVPKLWPPQAKSQLIGKDLDAGKDWRQKEKGVTEEEMVRRHHWLSVHKFEQAPGDGEAQGSLVCCSPRGLKELDTTEWLNWTEEVAATTVSTFWAASFLAWWACRTTITSSTLKNMERFTHLHVILAQGPC